MLSSYCNLRHSQPTTYERLACYLDPSQQPVLDDPRGGGGRGEAVWDAGVHPVYDCLLIRRLRGLNLLRRAGAGGGGGRVNL